MKKRLVVDVVIDDSITEEEILNRVDDVLADCAVGPADFTNLNFNPDSEITWDDEDDPVGLEGWKPEAGTALDYIYRQKGRR